MKQSIQDLLIAVVQNLRKLIAAIHNASENIYLALIDALISLLQAFATLLTTDLPFHTRSTSSLAAVDSWQHPLSPGVRATARAGLTPLRLTATTNAADADVPPVLRTILMGENQSGPLVWPRI